MWERCSPTIRHLELEYHLRSADALLAIPPCVAAVQLSSLRIRSRGRVHYRLTQNLCRFDLSQLNAFSLGPGVDVSWQDFAPVVRTIQVLDVAVHGILWQEEKCAIDLAAFPNLLLLHLSLAQPVPRMALAKLSTIIPTNRIHTIVISIMSGTDTLMHAVSGHTVDFSHDKFANGGIVESRYAGSFIT
ncbi:hypothetical protein B0H13DRAFT_2449374 [Mycena leptocephala]|nr:hypothetical protein B0H13DRAFT_2449374 [Mycena leptocephala]